MSRNRSSLQAKKKEGEEAVILKNVSSWQHCGDCKEKPAECGNDHETGETAHDPDHGLYGTAVYKTVLLKREKQI